MVTFSNSIRKTAHVAPNLLCVLEPGYAAAAQHDASAAGGIYRIRVLGRGLWEALVAAISQLNTLLGQRVASFNPAVNVFVYITH
jgi:hypothetical protein